MVVGHCSKLDLRLRKQDTDLLSNRFHRLNGQEQLEYINSIIHFGVLKTHEKRQREMFTSQLKKYRENEAARPRVFGLKRNCYFILHLPHHPEAEFLVCPTALKHFLKIGKERYSTLVGAVLLHRMTDEKLHLGLRGNKICTWGKEFDQ